MSMKFWYTDLTEDSGTPWFSTHLYYGVQPNGYPIHEIRLMTASLFLWRLKLMFALFKKITGFNDKNRLTK